MKTAIVVLSLLSFVFSQPQGTREAPPEPVSMITKYNTVTEDKNNHYMCITCAK